MQAYFVRAMAEQLMSMQNNEAGIFDWVWLLKAAKFGEY